MQIFTKKLSLLLLLSLLYGISVKAQAVNTVKADSLKKENRYKVRSTVFDAATGKPVSGINISVFDYSAAITDANGVFEINVPDYNATLMVSGTNYQTKDVPLKGKGSIDRIVLFETTYNSVYSNTATPFGTAPINQIISASSNVNPQGSWETLQETPDSYLQGRVPGLNVIRRSGTPEIGANLFLRGFSSLNATNAPLIIVDGLIYDNTHFGNSLISGHVYNPLADIDEKDIDNITVIKDAASIYGTKGANGAILITTAHTQELQTKIDVGIYSGYNYVPNNFLLPVMSANGYRNYLSDVLKTSGMTADQIAAQPYFNDELTGNPDYYKYHNNTNWQKQVFKNGYNSNYYLKISGGDNIARYALSVGYGSNKGITSGTDLTKYNTRFNADLNLSKHFTATANLAFSYNEQNLRDQAVADKTNPIYLSLIKAPIFRSHDVNSEGIESPNTADTDMFGISNPTAVIEDVKDLNRNYRFFGNINFKYELSKYANIQTLLGITSDKVRESTFVPRVGVANDTLNNAIADSRLGSQVQRLFSLTTDTHFSYDRVFNRIHHITANVGFRLMSSNATDNYNLGYNSALDQLISVGQGVPALRQTGGDIGKNIWINNYLSVDYKYKGKYFLSYNMAADASSRFGTTVPGSPTIFGAKMAILPSIGAGWLISSESFMSGVNFIELLKLRASYGLTGNDDIGNYTARQYYVSQNLLGLEGLVRGNIGNSDLQWEVNKKLNLGFDASLFNERVTLSADVFSNNTSHMLIYEPLPSIAGITYAAESNGAMKTNGVEVSITGRLINKSDLKWDLGFNVSTYRNKVTKLPETMQYSYDGATIITRVGSPANLFYGYQTNGVYASDNEATNAGISVRNSNNTLTALKGGDMRFVDQNGDKVIDNNDQTVIGNPNPKFTGGIFTSLSYKRLSLSALFNIVSGNRLYNFERRRYESESGTENQSLAVLNRWQANGQVTNIPRAVYGDPTGNSRFSDRWIEDGSYIRLRTLTVSYDVPVKKYFKYIKIYATGNNLFTYTKYMGYDPEFSATESILTQGIDNGLEPLAKSVQLGLRLGL